MSRDRNKSKNPNYYKRQLLPLTEEIKKIVNNNHESSSTLDATSARSVADKINQETESCLHMLDSYIECCYRKLQLADIIDKRKSRESLTRTPYENSEDENESRTLKVTMKLVDKNNRTKHVILKMQFPVICKFEPGSSPISKIDSKFKISKTFKINMGMLKKHLMKCGGEFESKINENRKREQHHHNEMYYQRLQSRMHAMKRKASDSSLNSDTNIEEQTFKKKKSVPERKPNKKVPLMARFGSLSPELSRHTEKEATRRGSRKTPNRS